MNSCRVAALQYCASATAADTLPRLLDMIARAAARGADLVTLPEAATFLAASRESLNDIAEWEDDSDSLRQLRAAAASHGINLLVGSIFVRRRDDHRLVNRCVLIGPDGRLSCQYDKIHMFDANVGDGRQYRESDYFASGSQMMLGHADGRTLGLSICYDLRFPALYRALALAGAQIITIPAAFTYNSGKAHWHVLLRARAIETGCFIVAPAQCGTHADGRRTYGHSLIVSPWGEILAEAATDDSNADACANDDIILADLDMARVKEARDAIPSLTSQATFS